jgi:hypothetical protein
MGNFPPPGVTSLTKYTHLFDDARHATEIRPAWRASPFARLLEPAERKAGNVVAITRDEGVARRAGVPSNALALDRNLTAPGAARRARLYARKNEPLPGP